MKYYTIQKLSAWEVAKETGFLTGNKKYIDESFINAYRWIMKQMSNRINNYNNEFPIWLWLDISNIHINAALEDEWVVLEVEVDEEQVLLSDFNAWHFVLNDWHFDEENNNISKEESWEYIFDREKLKKLEYDFDKNDLQGTTGKIDCKNIKVLKYILNKQR